MRVRIGVAAGNNRMQGIVDCFYFVDTVVQATFFYDINARM